MSLTPLSTSAPQSPRNTLNVAIVSFCGRFFVPFAKEPSGALRLLFPYLPSSADMAKIWITSLSHTHRIQYFLEGVEKLATPIMGIGRLREQIRPETRNQSRIMQDHWYPVMITSTFIKVIKTWGTLSLTSVEQGQALKLSALLATRFKCCFQPELTLLVCQTLAELPQQGEYEFSNLRLSPLPTYQYPPKPTKEKLKEKPKPQKEEPKERRRMLAQMSFQQLFGESPKTPHSQKCDRITKTPPKRCEFSDPQPVQPKRREWSKQELDSMLVCQESLDSEDEQPALSACKTPTSANIGQLPPSPYNQPASEKPTQLIDSERSNHQLVQQIACNESVDPKDAQPIPLAYEILTSANVAQLLEDSDLGAFQELYDPEHSPVEDAVQEEFLRALLMSCDDNLFQGLLNNNESPDDSLSGQNNAELLQQQLTNTLSDVQPAQPPYHEKMSLKKLQCTESLDSE